MEEENNLNVIAYLGITSKDFSKFIKEYQVKNQPSKVIVLCGINDLILSESETVNVDQEAILLKDLQEKYNVPVYVQLLFPVTESLINAKPQINNEKMENYNQLLTELCKDKGYFVIDTRNEFIGSEGYLQYTDDGLHISDDYQEQYIKNIVISIEN